MIPEEIENKINEQAANYNNYEAGIYSDGADFGYLLSQQTIQEKDKEISDKQIQINELFKIGLENTKEIERLKGLLEDIENRENDPYWYWGKCDVDGCEGVNCSGGNAWRETGYWKVCSKHSQEFREGKPQPKMKQSSIDREASRDKATGTLPTQNKMSTHIKTREGI